jgi:hypothetical protein
VDAAAEVSGPVLRVDSAEHALEPVDSDERGAGTASSADDGGCGSG